MNIDKKKIHKDSEIWNYENEIEFTVELISFFEDERKRIERERKSSSRHIAFEMLDDNKIYKSVIYKNKSIEEKIEITEQLSVVNEFLKSLTSKQRARYCLYKLYDMSFEDIAKIENSNKKSVWESVKQVEEKIKKLEK